MVKINKNIIGGALKDRVSSENVDPEADNIPEEANPCSGCCKGGECMINNEEWEEDT